MISHNNLLVGTARAGALGQFCKLSVGEISDNLRVSELMYPPQTEGTEFIELTNVSDSPIGLNGIQFTNGIDFTFSPLTLVPGGFVLAVKDVNAFRQTYGPGLPVAGQYNGALSNDGERIEIADITGYPLINFRYQNDWHGATDGPGFSMIATSSGLRAPDTLSEAGGWPLSPRYGGTPGAEAFTCSKVHKRNTFCYDTEFL